MVIAEMCGFGEGQDMRGSILLLALAYAAPALAQDDNDEPAPIVVMGEQVERAERAADQARAITLRPSANNPLPRRYTPLCLKLFGIDENMVRPLPSVSARPSARWA